MYITRMFSNYHYSQSFYHFQGKSKFDFVRARWDGSLEIFYSQTKPHRYYGRWDSAGFDDYRNRMDMFKGINERLLCKDIALDII